jgi:hypothetical protein
MTAGTTDRRRLRRLQRVEDHRILSARVRPGHRARLIDVSAGGALIETQYRLLPGASVELQMETDTRHTSIRGRILRCAVVCVRPTSVCYRGAIGFDRHLSWFVDESGKPPSSTKVRLSHPGRADATPQVI